MKKTKLKVLLRNANPKEIDAYEILPNLFIHKTITQNGEFTKYRQYTVSNNHGFRIYDPDYGSKLKDIKQVVIKHLSGLKWNIKTTDELSQKEREKCFNALSKTDKFLTALSHNQF